MNGTVLKLDRNTSALENYKIEYYTIANQKHARYNMDIKAKETLESAFKAYTGTMLFVSHDRYFISQLADAILVFEADRVMYYPFGYEHYLNHCRRDDGEDISALMEAENQALVAGLRAVPKPERHRLKEINTEEAYIDWRLRLAAEPVEAAREEVDRQLLIWDEEKLEEAVDNWTYECLKWYDVYSEELKL